MNFIIRPAVATVLVLGSLTASAAEVPSAADLPPTRAVTNRAPLQLTPFAPLPLGSVQPLGWLRTQCELQRDGLTGHAEDLYADFSTNSAWLGGTGENWERGPYYYKGLLPLAYVLNDSGLKKKAQKWFDWVLQSQRPDGFIGPAANNDWWPRMVATYALRDYYEATADARVITVLSNYFRHMSVHLPGRPLKEWGKARAADQMDVALWLYNRNGDTNLLPLVRLLREQAYDWVGIFRSNAFTTFGTDFHPKHNVNVQQALKFPAVWFQVSHDPADRDALRIGLHHLMRDHGLSFGINGGTEFVAGNSTIQGVELCSTVEAMLSLETAVQITGDVELADRLERISFNALPAGLANNIKALQYYTLPNHVNALHGGHGFNQDYANGTLPGPNSGYPCCRCNFHMGWPKLVQNAWAATSDGGLAAIAYAPSVVTASIDEQPVRITAETAYPFEEEVRFTVNLERPARFPLVLRMPGWCAQPTVTVNGESQRDLKTNSFHRLQRTWKNGDVVVVRLPMSVETVSGPSRSISVRRGPLVFGLKIQEEWKVRTADKHEQGFDEFEVIPLTPWNYALEIDTTHPNRSFVLQRAAVQSNPFGPNGTPITLRAQARRVDAWTNAWRQVHAFEPPISPVASANELERVSLIPVGAQHLRISWFPWLGKPLPAPRQLHENFDAGWTERWTVFGGNWLVDEGALNTVPASANGAKAIAMATDFTNFTYEAEVKVTSAGDAGLIFRASKPDIGADAYRGYYVGISAERNQVELGLVNNSWQSLRTAPINIAAEKFHVLRVEANGPRLRVFVDGGLQPVIEHHDSTFSSGMVGVRNYCPDEKRSIAAFRKLTAAAR
ncbi:MAG TPA: beta-L-arabinofuranosidase domain-containing protein [Verrucomicrobiae bacterium]|nr:beta-L-arabinofuranosidase domain-containing protein [Verrucomicrobiae bacterium]